MEFKSSCLCALGVPSPSSTVLTVCFWSTGNVFDPPPRPCVLLPFFRPLKLFFLPPMSLYLNGTATPAKYNTQYKTPQPTVLPGHTITAHLRNTAQLIAKLITTQEWFGSHPGQFTASTHCTGGWVGTRVGMDIFKENNLLPLPQIEPRTAKPVGQSLF
jgi:hypothetical protein